MPPDVRHLFVSPVAATNNSGRLVQGPNWNETHNLQQGPAALLGRSDSTPGQAATTEVLLDPATMAFVGGKLAAVSAIASLGVIVPVNYGAIGNGVADDTAAMQAAITAAAGKTLDGAGLTYKIMLPLTGVASNTTLRNATFDFSAMPDQPGSDYCLSAVGTTAATMALTSDTLAGTNIVNIASTASLVVDDLVYFNSTTVIEASTGAIYGQYERVKAINSGTQFTTVTNLAVDFTTAATAVVKKVTPVVGVTIRDCRFIGSATTSQAGLDADWCVNFKTLHCHFSSFNWAAIALQHCYKPLVEGCSMYKGVGSGLSYGVSVVHGCYHATIANCHGEDLRHTVTLGGTDGINLFTLVQGNHAVNSKDAGFDSHPAAMFSTFANNIVEASSEQFLASQQDGMISQSGHTTFIGNIIKGVRGGGIVYQPEVTGIVASALITGNRIISSSTGIGAASTIGISVDISATSGTDVEKLLITNNAISGNTANAANYGMLIYNKRSGVRIRSLIIANNQISDTGNNGIYVRTSAGALYDAVNISNNDIDVAGGRALYLTTEGAGAVLANLTGSGNILKAASIGIGFLVFAGSTVGPGKFGSNIYRAPITAGNIINTSGVMANITLQDQFDADTIAFLNPTITILASAGWYTFGRTTAQVVTLPDPTQWKNTELHLRAIAAGQLDSATANVTPITGAAASTVIFAASSAGKWAVLRSDGTTWRIVKAN